LILADLIGARATQRMDLAAGVTKRLWEMSDIVDVLETWEASPMREMMPIFRIFGFFSACAMAYQSFDAFRSAFTGTQPEASAPEKNPEAISTRLAGAAWGVISALLSLGLFWFSLVG